MMAFLGSFLAFTLLNGLVGACSWLWARRLSLDGWMARLLGTWVLFLGQIVFSLIALGMAGHLAVGGLLGFHGAMLGASWVYLRRRPNPSVGAHGGWAWPLAAELGGFAPLFLLAAGYLLALYLASALAGPPTDWDSLAYHLPFAVEWLQSGRLDLPYSPFVDLGTPYYGLHVELLQLWAILPFRGDLLVKLVSFAFLPGAAIALFEMGRQLRIGVRSRILAITLLVSMPVALGQTNVTGTDLAVAALFLVSTTFVLSYWTTRRSNQLWLSAIAVGIMIGCKFTAIQLAALLGPLVALSVGRKGAEDGWRQATKDALGYLGLAALFGGYLFARNLVVTGTPVFPATVGLLGLDIFEGPVNLRAFYGFTILANHLRDHYTTFATALTREYGVQWALLLGASLVAPFLWWRFRLRTRRDGGLALAGLYLLCLFAPLWVLYANTPYTVTRFVADTPITPDVLATGLRFALPTVVLMSLALAYVADRAGRFRGALEAAAAICVLQNVAAVFHPTAWRVMIQFDPGGGDLFAARIAFGLVAGLALGGLALGLRDTRPVASLIGWLGAPRGPLRRAGRAAAMLAILVAVGLSALGAYGLHLHRERTRFEYYRAVYGEGIVSGWEWVDRELSGERIAYAAGNRIYPLYGRRYENRVLYVNEDGCDDCVMHDYAFPGIEYEEWATRTGRPPDYEAWVDSLRERAVDYVFIDGGEVGWLRGGWGFPARDLTEDFELVLDSGVARIYRLARGE